MRKGNKPVLTYVQMCLEAEDHEKEEEDRTIERQVVLAYLIIT